ncbi:UNVERIFIED_CONTAM: hypothetical protein FKN15_010366 [Acipenser sinensis]
MNEILDLRRQVLVGHLTLDRMKDVKQHITARLDWGNEQLGLDLVPRKEFSMVDPDEISVTELYKLMEHRHRKKEPPVPASTHHLFVQMKSLMSSNLGEELEVFFSLYDSRENRPISTNRITPVPSSSYLQNLNMKGMAKSSVNVKHFCPYVCVFLFSQNRTPRFFERRQFDFKSSMRNKQLVDTFSYITVLTCSRCNTENEWYQIQENIIRKVNARYNLTGSNTGLAVSLQLLHGDIEQIRREYMVLFTRGVAITKKLGFSDVIMPGEMRNDLYITMERGEFEKGGKSVARNVEITVYVLDIDGQILKNYISAGSGEPALSEFHSFVLYHNNSPRWAELLKLPIPVDMFRGSHVRFEFRHCSRDMLDLLKWRAHPERITDSLSKLKEIDGSEIVKFLQDTLDTLFGILDVSSQKYGLKVFDCLVHIINLLQDSKFHHFKPVMDTYIESHFAGALSYRDLIKVLKWYVDRIVEAEHQERIQQVLKATEYIFKYIIQSRRLFSLATGGQSEEEFRCCVHELFMSIRFFLSQESKGSSPVTQTQFLQDTLDTLFGILDVSSQKYGLKVFDCLVHIINLLQDSKFQHFKPVMDTYIESHFAGALSYRDLIKVLKWYVDRIVEAEHQERIQQVLKATEYIFKYIIQSRRLFSLATGGQSEEEFRCCVHELFMSIRFFLSQESKGSSPVTQTQETSVSEEIDMIVESLLGVLLRTILEITNRPQPAGTALQLQFQDVTGEFVACLLVLLRQMTDKHYQQLLEGFTNKEELRDFLLQIFTVFRILIRPEMFPKDWTVMRLVTNNVIITTVLYLSDALRKNFLNENFDYKVWDSYYYLSVIFINQPCLQLEMFSPSKKKKVLEKYGDMRVMMGCEIFSMWQNLGEHKVNFIPAMIGPFLEVTLVPQPDLRNVMIPIFHDMMDWEQRRSGSFKQPAEENREGDLEGEWDFIDSHCYTAHGKTVRLQNFYKTELNKEEMYIRYIHKLYDLHLKAQNYTEAAYTLLLYDELLEWSDRPLREFLNYPMQTEWQRKEYLHLTIIQNFDRGKCWENGVILCRELADQYEAYYDYRNLSKMRMMEASLYDKIMDQQRLEPEFFRVGFYGKKFPFFLRNKEFVCRGHDYERLEAFQQRMLNEFPHAIAMQHVNQPDETIFQAEAQYLQIYAVSPIPESQDVLQRDGVPDNIKSFYKVNHIWRFRYDRPFHKGTKDKENEFKSLWVERTTLTLVQSLPGISRWFEVEKRELVEMSPLENAIEVIENKNLQLRALITQCQARQMHNINPLTMCLNGVIDAAVNGGLARYQEAQILEYGLAVHEKFVPQDMRPLHKKLVDQFHLMKSSLGIQDFPAYVRASPVHFTNGSPRVCRNSMPNVISPDGARVLSRRSPLSYPAVNRYSSSSLSSQASNEVSNITGQSESSDEVFNMQGFVFQPSPSTSSLSSTHSASPNVTSSAPSSARGSPLLSDKHKHSRENFCLSPRERPCSAIYPNPLEAPQRMLAHQIGDNSLPRSDPNISAPDKVVNPTPSSWSLDSGKEANTQFSETVGKLVCPPVPPRTPQPGSPAKNMQPLSPVTTLRSPQKQSSVQSFTPSPTEYQSSGLVSNSPVLSGSYSSGISSLSRCSVSETSGTEAQPSDQMLTTSVSSGSDELTRRENKTPPPYSVYERSNSRRPVPLPQSLSVPFSSDPPALPPKPHQLRPNKLEHEGKRSEQVSRPRPLPRKVSQL